MFPGRLTQYLLAAWLLCQPWSASALSTDSEQPIHIEADKVVLDERRGVSTYTGNVRMTQGSLVLTAEIVRVFSPEKVLKRIIAEGDLAKLRQLTDDGKELHAEAKKMVYIAKTSIVILTGNAKLWEGGNEFVSQRIEYHLLKEQIHGGTGKDGGRVEAIIMPETIEEQKEKDKDKE